MGANQFLKGKKSPQILLGYLSLERLGSPYFWKEETAAHTSPLLWSKRLNSYGPLLKYQMFKEIYTYVIP